MKPEDVLAVVVSYNGLDKLTRGVDALRPQVGRILVVDNGSEAETLTILDSLELDPRVEVIRLPENTGVAHALNVGVRLAKARGYEWLLTMDQDTVVDGTMVSAFEAVLNQNPEFECLAPTLQRTSERALDARPIRYAITSGNLLKVRLFDEVGPYDEAFFIDCVDFDFCLRLRRAGHVLFRVPGAFMQHDVGLPMPPRHPLRKFYTFHPPVRRYYMVRNYMYLARRHVLRFPGFILKLGALQIILLLLIGFYDPEPSRSYRAMLKGIRDYLSGVSGRAGADIC
jgi:rhamnosyltransferase